jgi:hypothetical protein
MSHRLGLDLCHMALKLSLEGHMAFILGHVVAKPRFRPKPCDVAFKLLLDLGHAIRHLD